MKCESCGTEIRGGVKKCPLCGTKIDYSAQMEEKREQEKAYTVSKTPSKPASWKPPTPEEQERARERERQRMAEAERIRNDSKATKGLIIAIIGTIALVVIQLLSFKFNTQSIQAFTLDNLSHDIMNYRIWFGGLFVGSVLIVIASCILIRLMTDKYYSEKTIFGVILCAVSIMLIVLSLSKLEQRKKDYDVADRYYSQYQDKAIREQERRNEEVDSVVKQIEDRLNGY